MRLVDLENDLYRRLGGSATNDKTRFDSFINETQREILRMKHFQIFRRKIVTISSIANVPFVAIPRGAVRLLSMLDRTNDYYLEEKSMQWLRSIDPSLRATAANPWAYVIYDMASPVMRQPASAGIPTFVSSSAGDTTQTVFMEGMRTPTTVFGPYSADSKTVNGVTPVSFSFSMESISKFYLSATCTGHITMSDASANVLSVIPAGQTFARYTLMHLYPVPTTAQTYYCDIETHVEDMSNANDEPLIPEDFHHLLSIGARIKEYEKREKWKERSILIATEWDPEIRKMKTWVNRQTGIVNPYGDARRRYSQLGPWFEAGT